jgi:hypothetical protein
MNAHVAEYWLILSMIAERQKRFMAQWYYYAQYELENPDATETDQ